MRRAPEIRDRRPPIALLCAALAALLPVLGLFTTQRIFFVRDLSFFFWSRHLWLRHTLFAGEAAWWDPYVAGGQSAIADALHQQLMPLTMAVRLLPSDVVSFNLWVALPLPLAAIGTFLFLRRRLGDAAAALGACVFALSGPTVSMLNTPNLAWSVALMPWVLWRSTCEVRGSRIGILALVFALQGLCGEPVTWLATGVLALACAPRVSVAIGLAAGAGLASAQLVPTLLAGVRAQRSALATPDFWSLHPVALWETIAPHLFGDVYTSTFADLPWLGALNFGRDPFFYSLYLGPLVLMLAGIAAARGRGRFWIGVAVVSLLLAVGGYTPIYPLIRRALPELLYFRFPAKYMVFTVFACAVLAAEAWESVLMLPPEGGSHEERKVLPPEGGSHGDGGPSKGGRDEVNLWLPALAGSLLLLAAAAAFLPAVTTRVTYWLALATHLRDPAAGAAFLASAAPPLAIRATLLLFAGSILIAIAPRWRVAAWLLFALTCADLAVANRGLNPTAPVGNLSAPSWYTAAAGSARLYVGGRVRGFMNVEDPDATPKSQAPPEVRSIERRSELNAELPLAPSGWGVREALSYDLPHLWPADYEAAVEQFEQAAPDVRAAFLRRAGVRLCVLPAGAAAPIVADVPDWSMRVFGCGPSASRVFIASRVETAADGPDAGWERDALFDPTLPEDLARVTRIPPIAAAATSPAAPSARIVEDRSTRVVVEATLPAAGVLVLRDSYDPSWHAEVDGRPAEIVRANGLYRGVSLPAGRHVIRFAYRPRDLVTGLIMSGATALMLLAGRFRRARTRQREAGFTLIELLVVLAIIAILLAIAFNEYRGMQARGNEVSALASMRSIATAQWQFAATCGNLHYVTKLPDLAKPVPSTGEAFLSPDLTSADTIEKSGYKFQMAAKPLDDVRPGCNGAAVAAGYAATADPVNPPVSGTAYYGVNADRILYIDEEKTFTGTLPESGAPDHGSEIKN